MDRPDTDLFDEAAKNGGLIDFDTLDRTSAEILGEIAGHGLSVMEGFRQHMEQHWATRPFRLGFVENAEVNAWATKTKDTDLVLINRGVVEKVFGAFCGLMCIPEFLPQVGEPRDDRRPVGPLPAGFPRFPLLGKILPDHPIRAYYPSDVARGAFAIELGTMALYFVMLHEIGHVLAGHLELDDAPGAVPLIREVGFAGTFGSSGVPRRIVECDADAFSSHGTSFVGLHPGMEPLRNEAFGWKGVPGSHAAWISYSTAIGVLFRVLDEAEQQLLRPSPNDYPHPAVRSNFVMGRAFGLAAGAGTLNRNDVGQLTELSLLAVERFWSSMGIPGRHFDLQSGTALRIAELTNELVGEYTSWLPVLSKHARIKPRWHAGWPSLH